MTEGWYALHVKPRSERVVSRHLEDKGYEAFVPFYRSRRLWSDRVKIIDLPLFPTYAFCRIAETAFGRIVTTPGVIRVVGAGRAPIPIDAAEIDSLKRAVACGRDLCPWAFPQIGQRVEIAVGALRGVQGVLTRSGNGDRLVVSISLLQRAVAVELDSSDIVPVEESYAWLNAGRA